MYVPLFLGRTSLTVVEHTVDSLTRDGRLPVNLTDVAHNMLLREPSFVILCFAIALHCNPPYHVM